MPPKFSQNAAKIQFKFCRNSVIMQSKCSQNAAKIQPIFSQNSVSSWSVYRLKSFQSCLSIKTSNFSLKSFLIEKILIDVKNQLEMYLTVLRHIFNWEVRVNNREWGAIKAQSAFGTWMNGCDNRPHHQFLYLKPPAF